MSTEQDRVRDLLAQLGRQEASHPPPAPEHVVARVEATLEQLRPTAPVVALEARGRRPAGRLVGRFAAAAAVVVLLGTGGIAALGLTGGSSQDEGSAAPGTGATGHAAAPEERSDGTTASPGAEGPGTAAEPDSSSEEGALGPLVDLGSEATGPGSSARQGAVLPELSGADFAEQAQGLLDAGVLVADTPPGAQEEQARAVAQAGCVVPDRPGTLLPVVLDGEPAVLLLEPAPAPSTSPPEAGPGADPSAGRTVLALGCLDATELVEGRVVVAGGGD